MTKENTDKHKAQCAVVLHLFYNDLWPEIARYLSRIPLLFDLYVTIPEADYGDVRPRIVEQYPTARIYAVANRGRDTSAFFHVMREIAPDRYVCICKIHSKKTPLIANGGAYRQELYDKLMGSAENIRDIHELFARNPSLGLVAPAGYVLAFRKFAGSNKETTLRLADRLHMPFDTHTAMFIAGGMFWFRQAALQPLLDLQLTAQDFEEEKQQDDGTLAHAVERLFFHVAFYRKYWLLDSDLACALAHRVLSNDDFKATLHPDNSAVLASEYRIFHDDSFAWDRDYFDNGMPLLEVHKKIYREHPDLRKKFPNPYSTEPGHSYYQWLITSGPIEYPDVLGS